MSVLRLSNVSVKYQNHVALSGVSLKLNRGEQHVVLGASGSGKTSLLRAIAGFLPISDGEIWIGEKKANSVGHTLVPNKRGVGVVFQDYALFTHLSVLDNISFGLKAKKRESAREWLLKVDLAGKENSSVDELSGGEQQRVALARALAAKPSLILLDEPFSNLDRTLRRELRALTRDTLVAAGQTAIYVTHDSEEAMDCGDSLSVLEQGKLMQTGSAQNIYLNPRNRQVAESLGEVHCFSIVARQGNMVDCGWFKFESEEGQVGESAMFRSEQLLLKRGGSLVVKSLRFKGGLTEVRCEYRGDERVFWTESKSAYSIGDAVSLSVEGSLGVDAK